MALIGTYTLELLLFYWLAHSFFWILLYLKGNRALFSFLLAMLCTFVASEYYELPVFLRYGSAHWLHHVNTAWMFILLLVLAKTRVKHPLNWLVILLGPVVTAPILFFYPQMVYLARLTGLACLWIVTFNSPGVGGKTASNIP